MRESEAPRDSLPYTAAFDDMKRQFEAEANEAMDDHRFWRLLDHVGKSGGLSTPGRRKKGAPAPKLSDAEQLEILRLLPDGIGPRDHLPYSPQFEEMHRRFGRSTGRELTAHEFWRAVSHVAKNARKPHPVHESAPVGSLTTALTAFLDDNNPWWRGKPARAHPAYCRWAFEEIVRRLNGPLAPIVAVRGSRRVGKSVLQAQLVEELLLTGKSDPTRKPVDPARILAVQFDDAPALGGIPMPIQAIVRWYETHVLRKTLNEAAREGRPAYLLFDEVQNLADWSVQLKFLADKNDARILVTGSSALRIAEGHDNLAGRLTTIELGLLRLREIAGIRGLGELPAFTPQASLEEWRRREFWLGLVEHGRRHSDVRDRAFARFSERGGYPLCHVAIDEPTDLVRQQIVGEVIHKTIEHDPIGSRGRRLDPAFVRSAFRLICRYAGQAVTPRRLADELQQSLHAPVSPAKVSEAIGFLADALLIACVPPLELNQRKQTSPAKLCVCDPFVRNGVLQETTPLDPSELGASTEAASTQAGHVIESVLGYFLRGILGAELAWLAARARDPELDFVLTIGSARIPIEVKYRRQRPDGAAIAGIEWFCAKPANNSAFGIVVTQAAEGPLGDRAIAIPASTLLLLK